MYSNTLFKNLKRNLKNLIEAYKKIENIKEAKNRIEIQIAMIEGFIISFYQDDLLIQPEFEELLAITRKMAKLISVKEWEIKEVYVCSNCGNINENGIKNEL